MILKSLTINVIQSVFETSCKNKYYAQLIKTTWRRNSYEMFFSSFSVQTDDCKL